MNRPGLIRSVIAAVFVVACPTSALAQAGTPPSEPSPNEPAPNEPASSEPASSEPASSEPASAAAPTSSPGGNSAGAGDFVLPAGWRVLVDDTNTISVAVPETWSDIDTAPQSNPDGTLRPHIDAATDLGVFIDTFDAPGLTFLAVPYSAETQTEMSRYGLTGGCRDQVVQPYDDGAFAGLQGIWTACGTSGTPQWHQVVASPASQSFTLILQVQITGPAELAVLDNILRSFNFTPQGGAASGPMAPPTLEPTTSTTSDATTTTTTTTTVAPLPSLSGTVPFDSRPLIDDVGALRVSVPSAWTETDTSPRDDDGTVQPWIAASTDLEAFLPDDGVADTFSVPGVVVTALGHTTDLTAPLRRFSYADECTAAAEQPIRVGELTGLAQVFSDCGGTGTRITNLALNPPDRSYTVFVLLQLPVSADASSAYDTVLSSVALTGIDPDSTAPSTVVTTTPGAIPSVAILTAPPTTSTPAAIGAPTSPSTSSPARTVG